jgi:hypothetical protein
MSMNSTMRVPAAAAVAATLLLGACTTMGTGGGDLRLSGGGEAPVLLSWKSGDGGIDGTMQVMLPEGTYKGRFFQITQQTQREAIAPLWAGWHEGWYGWPYWGYGAYGPYGVDQFITRYSGKVVANLADASGRHLRCRLHLVAPARGMAGGGEGECQRTGGGTVHARF